MTARNSIRIALVNPVASKSAGYHSIAVKIPQVGLQVLARLTPENHKIDIIDECFGVEGIEDYLSPERYDLVGITGYTSSAARAYHLAGVCRARGIPCIMGGPHASAVPDEAAAYFDSVAVGECDLIWPKIIEDAAAGRLAPRYESSLPELANGLGASAQEFQPINGEYDISCIQLSRGCPVGCDYCGVTRFNGPRIRHRDVEDILREWNEAEHTRLLVVDDNFYGVGKKSADWAKALLREIIKRGKRHLWFSQTSINMGADLEGLELAYKAGCRGMLVGFESFNPISLAEYRKNVNKDLIEHYQQLIDGFHRCGLAVMGSFIVGAEADTMATVSDTVYQAVKMGVDIVQICNLTPLPGTKMYDRWLEAGRITKTNYPEDWEHYTFIETVFDPTGMTAEELDRSIYELRAVSVTEPWVWKRTLKTIWKTRSLTTGMFVYGVSTRRASLAQAHLPRDQERFGPLVENDRTRKLRRAFKLFGTRGNE